MCCVVFCVVVWFLVSAMCCGVVFCVIFHVVLWCSVLFSRCVSYYFSQCVSYCFFHSVFLFHLFFFCDVFLLFCFFCDVCVCVVLFCFCRIQLCIPAMHDTFQFGVIVPASYG